MAIRLYENIGRAYVGINDFYSAKDSYQKALKLNPYLATLYKNLADVYYLENNLDQAIKLNQRGFMLSPKDYHWPLAISLLYRDQKNIAEARKYLDQALKIAPENGELKKYYEELSK